MLQDLKGRTFYPSDIEAATSGYVDRKTQQSWHAREKWLTPTETPMGGKPREYRLEHVLEAAILAACVQYGLTLDLGRQAIERRLLYEAVQKNVRKRGVAGAWRGEVREAIFDLPELQRVDLKSPFYWAIYTQAGLAPPRQPATVNGVRLIDGTATALDIVGKATMVVLIDITGIVSRAMAALQERGGQADSQ